MVNPEQGLGFGKMESEEEDFDAEEKPSTPEESSGVEKAEEENDLENLERKMEEAEENSEKLKAALEEIDSYFPQIKEYL